MLLLLMAPMRGGLHPVPSLVLLLLMLLTLFLALKLVQVVSMLLQVQVQLTHLRLQCSHAGLRSWRRRHWRSRFTCCCCFQ